MSAALHSATGRQGEALRSAPRCAYLVRRASCKNPAQQGQFPFGPHALRHQWLSNRMTRRICENSSGRACLWCGRSYVPRRGGSPQRFCGASCRNAFWSALRRWGERAVAAGIVTPHDIRNADLVACTLLPRPISSTPVREAPSQLLTAMAPRAANSYTTSQQELERRMAQAIAVRRRG